MPKKKIRKCRICKTKPRYKHKKQGMLDVCKKCYHAHVWEDRPAARKARKEAENKIEYYDEDEFI